MKHPYLCACLTFAMCVTAYHSGVRLNAAELWNSTGAGASSSSSSSYYIKKDRNTGANRSNKLFNGTKKFNPANGTELFNSQDPSKVSSGEGGLEVAIEAYKNVKMGRQKSSKQFKTMSSSAVANRQADIDHALQREYDRRRETARNGIEAAKADEAARIRNARARQEQLAAIQAARAADDYEYQRDRAKYVMNRKTRYGSKSSSTVKLKKPARLFNDPNE